MNIDDATLIGETRVKVDDNHPAPEKPGRFNENLKRDFGEIGGFARYRVVWGQSEKAWRAGRNMLKYVYAVFREDRFHGVHVHNYMNRGVTKKLSWKEAESYQTTKGEIVVPQIEHFEKEIGDPFYWLEFYAPSSFYGTEEEWNLNRWLKTEDGHQIDLAGPHPSKGRYEPLLRLSVLEEDGSELYRPLNDNTYDWVRSMLQGDETKLNQALGDQRKKLAIETEKAFDDSEIDKEVEEIRKHRIIYT